jgi:hypothetical protein
MGSSLSKSKHSFFKPIKDRKTKGVGSRDIPVLLKPKSAKPNNFFAQKETPSVAKRNRRRNNKNASVNLKKKKKISKSLIGKPTNFQHTTHIGAGEIRSGQLDVSVKRRFMQGCERLILNMCCRNLGRAVQISNAGHCRCH